MVQQNSLLSELSRLYFVTPPKSHNGEYSANEASGCMAANGCVRAMVLELARPAQWDTLGAVWRGVQTDLGLPEPAIAVSGIDGHQLWFSLAEPVCAADAQAFLEALRLRYLDTVEVPRIGMFAGANARIVPALQAESGQWSAFVSCDLAGIFTDEPWLDIAPNPLAQARLLSRLECIKPGAFKAALAQIGAPAAAPIAHAAPLANALRLGPKNFLSDVMNDPAVALHLRIEAAKALLPYVEGDRHKCEG